MKLTPLQQQRFWREWSRITRHFNWDKEESELQRKEMLRLEGYTSLTEVDKMQGFDDILGALLALRDPSDLNGQLAL